MSAKKFFYVQLGLLGLLIAGVLASAVAGNILLEKQSKKLTELRLQNKTIDAQQTALVQAKKDIEKYNQLNEIAKSIVPQDKDQAKTVREIVKIAQDNRIPIKSVSFDSSNLGDMTKTTAVPDSSGGGSAASSAPKVPSVTQVKPIQGINNVYTFPIQVETSQAVSYQNFLAFLESLEKNRRTAHVGSINLKPSADGKSLEFTLALNAYVKANQ